MSEFHALRNALYARFPEEAREYESEFAELQEELRKCQQDAIELQARLAEAEQLLDSAVVCLARHTRGSTHWQGCEDTHPTCGTIKAIDAFLGPADSAPVVQRTPSGLCTHDDSSWCTDECRPSPTAKPDSASAAPFHDAICERRDPKVYACFCDTRKAGSAEGGA